MTLDNLLGINLERIEADPLTIQRLLEAAQRNIRDAQLEVVSNENRFDAAYKAIMQMANAALQANGYRALSSKPGHHQTMIQTLPVFLFYSSTDDVNSSSKSVLKIFFTLGAGATQFLRC